MQNMQKLQVIEFKGLRVLTTKQIAEAYGTDVSTIQYNFRYNKSRYELGKHYIEVSGEELKEMKSTSEIHSSLKQVKHLYLWTEKGALLHAKSLNTDKAWEVYDYLLDFYFRVKENNPIAKEKKQSGRLVVDVPENVKIQEAMKVTKSYLTALDVSLSEYNVYRSEENYECHCMMMNNIAVTLLSKVLDLLKIKPNMVEKIL